jgi:hypothetical protein
MAGANRHRLTRRIPDPNPRLALVLESVFPTIHSYICHSFDIPKILYITMVLPGKRCASIVSLTVIIRA